MKIDFTVKTKTGRVDTYILRDEKNLSHRSDASKIIDVFVPKSYDGVTPHGILYFFDAQNLFSNAGYYTEHPDPYGGWKLDIVLDELHEKYGRNIIVVGIDNADKYREQELFPEPAEFGKLSPLATAFEGEDYSHGYLEGLSDFMMQTLHPFICENYTVNEKDIGIGGSSMGGIASFWCALRELGFYKYVLSYSPAYALYEKEDFENYFGKKRFADNLGKLPKIHIYCGEGDFLEKLLIADTKQMKDLLVKYGYDGNLIGEKYVEQYPHNEESWREILPESFEFLFDIKD